MNRIRNYFLTGLVIAAPLFITIFITWNFIQWIDGLVKPLVPSFYQRPFVIPGFGVVVAIAFITMLGFLTANLVGRRLVSLGESILDRMPLVRNLYRGLKQIFETALSDQARAFKKAALVEYPRKGLWSIAFVSGDARGEVQHHLDKDGQRIVGVFMPTTPNPTSGYLIYVRMSDLIMLDMSVEDAAKLVISAGLVAPDFEPEPGEKITAEEAATRAAALNPPSAA